MFAATFFFDNPIEAIQKHTQGRKQEAIFMDAATPKKKGGHQENRNQQDVLMYIAIRFHQPIKSNQSKEMEEVEKNDIGKIIGTAKYIADSNQFEN